MTWGMPYDRFWHSTWTEYFTYLRKARIEQEQKAEMLDDMAWMNGIYTGEAVKSLYQLINPLVGKHPKIYPYPKIPLLKKEQLSERDKEKKMRAEAAIREHNLLIRAKLSNKRASGAPSE